MGLQSTFTPVIDLLFPPRCALCGNPIGSNTGVCSSCWQTLAIPGEPCCASCQRPFGDTLPDGGTCAPCLANPPKHAGIAAATLYNDASRKLVLALKHGNRVALAPTLAGLMVPKLAFVDELWLLVPVPLHRWRLWKRGYNQAVELGREIARHTGARLIVDGLERRKATPSLGGLGKLARARVLSGAITAPKRRLEVLKGAKVVLIDDVLTSGATSNACVSALRRAGAQKVIVACFARVLDEALDVV